MSAVLDTHALVWWSQEPSLLGEGAAREIDRADFLVVPVICFWEVALLVRRKRLALKRNQTVADWAAMVLAIPRVRAEPLTPELALAADALAMHPDPADRFIAATALSLRAPVVTKDALLRGLAWLRTVW